MHIPDNYLSPASCAVMAAAFLPLAAVAARKVVRETPGERVVDMGLGAAFSFLVMMFNVPLPGGTSGHATGGVLLAALLGPWQALVSTAVALLMQALFFGDGGILSFGANAFNMAFAAPFLGYFIYRAARDRVDGNRGEIIGLALGSYVGINAAALCAALELGVQPLLFRTPAGLPMYNPYPPAVTVPALLLPHLLIAGAAEALFAVGIFSFVRKVSPGMIYTGRERKTPLAYLLLVAGALLSPLGLLAAGPAWGEWSPRDIGTVVSGGQPLGFTPPGMARGTFFHALFPGYTMGGVPGPVAYVVFAAAGAGVLLVCFKLIGHLLKGRRAARPK